MKVRLLVLLLVAWPLLAQTAPAQKAPEPEPVVAIINGETITVRELDRMYAKLSPQDRQSYEQSGGKQQFLDHYIRKKLIIQEAIKQGLDKQPDVAFDLRQARDQVLFDRFITDVVAEEVISEAELLAYYEEHKGEYRRPEMIRARHILARPGSQAGANTTGDDALTDEEALQKIQALAMHFKTVGGNFAEAAAQFSEDNSAMLGGDLGWFARGKMVKDFEDVAFRLKKSETSEVVQTPFGYHVIFVEDRREAGIAPYSEVREQIREKFLMERSAQILAAANALTQELRAVSRISVNRENL